MQKWHKEVYTELIGGRKKHNREKKINKQLKIADCEPYGNSPSGEAAQTPASATSKQGLGREVRAASLRVRTGLNAPRAI